MAEAQIADDAVKAQFRIEGRQLYTPPRNPHHKPFPPLMSRAWPGETLRLPELTVQQRVDVDAMFAEGDERRAAASSVEEIERSIALCKRALGRVPVWMVMALAMLREQRQKKYREKAAVPEK